MGESAVTCLLNQVAKSKLGKLVFDTNGWEITFGLERGS
jgi:hypothetical protein